LDQKTDKEVTNKSSSCRKTKNVNFQQPEEKQRTKREPQWTNKLPTWCKITPKWKQTVPTWGQNTGKSVTEKSSSSRKTGNAIFQLPEEKPRASMKTKMVQKCSKMTPEWCNII
jgi:hypothetical protein